MDFGGKKSTGTATSLIDGMQYLAGALIGGWGVAKILDYYKNNGSEFWIWPLLPIPMVIIGGLVSASLWNLTPSSKKV